VRVGLQRNYKQDFRRNILPIMGDMELNGVTVDTLESFRIHLVDERGLALKTARNIIDGSLRAFRDAGRRIDRNPFKEILTTGGRACLKKSPIRIPKRNETQFWLTIAQTVHLGLTRSFVFGSGRERDQAKLLRSNGEALI